jgi:hypothetical protein
LGTALVALALAVSLLDCALWIPGRDRVFQVATRGSRVWVVSTGPSGFEIVRYDPWRSMPPLPRFWTGARDDALASPLWNIEAGSYKSGTLLGFQGWASVTTQFYMSDDRTRFLSERELSTSGGTLSHQLELWVTSVAYWKIAVATGAVPAIAMLAGLRRRLRRRRRTRRGRCEACGYDLRATPQRCPECGTEPASRDGRKAIYVPRARSRFGEVALSGKWPAGERETLPSGGQPGRRCAFESRAAHLPGP